MLSKAKIKLINSLKLNKYRREHKLFLAEGSINVLDFLQSEIQVVELFATADWSVKHAEKLENIEVSIVSQKEFGKITALKTPSEVLALLAIPEYPEFSLRKVNDLVLMLDDIKDPGNLGTIIRTADWFGIRQIICSLETVDAYNPKVVQASMGSLARVEVHYAGLSNVLKTKPEDLPVFGALLDGKPLNEMKETKKGIILIGSEAHGISEKLIPFIDEKLTIPAFQGTSSAKAESLNASIATAIICYAFRNAEK
ncbi:MAG TPA: RNA methyltransferase [Bacteroidales bacterium]